MDSIASAAPERTIVIGVDTHKHLHVAVALDELGARLGELTISADSAGYAALAGWAEGLGRPREFGIEGTGSYGVGLASFLRRRGHAVIEVNRGDRRGRRANGKSDTLDAEAAARAVLAGEARAVPKSADGACEMIRQVKIARDTAVKARTQALITLKCIVVNAPAELREQLAHLSDKKLIDRCAALRPGPIDSTTASAKHTLRALARRWLTVAEEIQGHDRVLEQLTAAVAPSLRDGFGIGADTAAEMLIVFGDNPEQIPLRSRLRQALRRRADPRLIGQDHTPSTRPRRPPPGELRALPRRNRADALSPAHDRLRHPAKPRRPQQARNHPLPQALPRP